MALAAGPKNRNTKPLPPCEGDVVGWVEYVTGEALYDWQRDVLRDLAGTTPGRPRVAYVQVPRKNGKTRLAAVLALVEACLLPRRHIYAIADSERNLNSVLIRELRELIGASEHLRDSVLVYKDHLEVPETDSFIATRPNNFKASQGINPHLVLFDEVHLQKNSDTWSGMQMAGAARVDALLFGITTPGYDVTSMAHNLYQAVKAGDPSLYGKIHEAPADADLDDRDAWRIANPCHTRTGFMDGLEFDRGLLPEHEFARFRMGRWTATASAWLPYGAWDACADPGRDVPPDGTRVWIGFDGSFSGDSTALVGVTEDRHCFVINCWENPGRTSWRVPRDEVEDAITAAFNRWNVVELLADPPYWEREISEWELRWPGRVLQFPTWARARMAPACSTFYSAVMEQSLTHDGDPRLARHLANCVVKATAAGDVITKSDRNSPAKIDLGVAAVIAYSRASVATKPRQPLVALF